MPAGVPVERRQVHWGPFVAGREVQTKRCILL